MHQNKYLMRFIFRKYLLIKHILRGITKIVTIKMLGWKYLHISIEKN
jgi:hypothetical protein